MSATEAADTPQETKPTPVFGSGSSLGAGTGFAGFTGTSALSAEASGADAGEDENEAALEEECQADFKPVVQLEEVETSTGEEDEESLLELKCKLYRFDTGGQEWKERGVGHVRLLKHKESQRIRLLMRQEKTLKIRANHIVMAGIKLQEHAGSDKAWVWSTVDFADGDQKVELFCMRFGTIEKAQEFKAKFEEAQAANKEVLGGGDEDEEAGEEKEESSAAAADPEVDALADEVASKATVAGESTAEEAS